MTGLAVGESLPLPLPALPAYSVQLPFPSQVLHCKREARLSTVANLPWGKEIARQVGRGLDSGAGVSDSLSEAPRLMQMRLLI